MTATKSTNPQPSTVEALAQAGGTAGVHGTSPTEPAVPPEKSAQVEAP